jgi:creatinine amidohydrolase
VVELARLTWQEAETALRHTRLAIIPVGSCEQHGPHLRLATDIEIAQGFARRLADDLDDVAILCPPLPYGLSEHHMGFPGTLTLSLDSFMGVLFDLLSSLRHHGIDRVLVVNGHGGNVDALRLVARRARKDLRVLMGSVMWAQLAADVIAPRVSSDKYGHACEVETSVAMVLAPECVHSDRIGPPAGGSAPEPLTDPPGPFADRPIWFEEWTPNGALGDPRRADLGFGRDIVEAAYERALSFAKDLAHRDVANFGGREQ